MQCENCNAREAAIHLTQIVNDSVTTVHLCETCAEQKGIHSGESLAKYPLSDFLASMGKGAAGGVPSADDTLRCSTCGATLRDFREVGRLGCPACYDSFGRHLRDLLRRLHGSTQHVGEQYVSQGGPRQDQASALVSLREQLRRAVEAEHFELAAELRDRIRVLE